jgi:hypothetical protein
MFNSLKTSNKTQKSVYQSQIFPADKIVGEQVFPKDRLSVAASVFPPDNFSRITAQTGSAFQSQIFPADKIVGEQVFPKDRLTVEASVFPPDSYVTPAAKAQTDGNAKVYALRPTKSDDLTARAA